MRMCLNHQLFGNLKMLKTLNDGTRILHLSFIAPSFIVERMRHLELLGHDLGQALSLILHLNIGNRDIIEMDEGEVVVEVVAEDGGAGVRAHQTTSCRSMLVVKRSRR